MEPQSPPLRRRLPYSSGPGLRRLLEAVAKAADGGDDVSAEFLADSGHEHFDRVRIPVEVLVVDMLNELGSAHHLALVVHEVGEELVFLRGELHRLASLGHLAGARVEAN